MNEQLNRIEAKLDKVLVSTVENRMTIDQHTKIDSKIHKGLIVLIIFVLSMHSVEAISFIKEIL